MQRTLLMIGAAAVVLASALPVTAHAQRAGGAALAAPGGGGGAAIAPGGGAPRAMAPSGAAIAPGGAAPRTVAPGGAAIAVAPSGRTVTPGGAAIAPGAAIPAPGGQRFAQPGGGTWQGRRHFRHGPSFGFAVPYPYYDDYATPYGYQDDSCYELRFIRGAYRRIWVCD